MATVVARVGCARALVPFQEAYESHGGVHSYNPISTTVSSMAVANFPRAAAAVADRDDVIIIEHDDE